MRVSAVVTGVERSGCGRGRGVGGMGWDNFLIDKKRNATSQLSLVLRLHLREAPHVQRTRAFANAERVESKVASGRGVFISTAKLST